MEFDLSEILGSLTLGIEECQYLDQLLNHRTIIFNEEVDTNIIEKVFIPLKNFEEDTNTAPVTLILNSPGGSVSDGFFLAHYISQYKKRLNILVCGYAASMAAVILAAGGKNNNVIRMCYPSTYGLIHDGFITLSATESKSAGDIMAFNDRVDKDIRDFIIKNTNITEQKYDEHARKQWFLSADEMKENGLIDKILGVD